MTIETPSQQDMLDLANKVIGDETGLRTLVKDVKTKVQAAQREQQHTEAELERAKAKLVAIRTTKENWLTFLTLLENLAEKWGVQNIAVLPTQPRTQENPDVAPAPQEMDPETRERMDDGKLCMYKDQKTKKWCPTRLAAAQKKKGSDFCSKHHAIIYGN